MKTELYLKKKVQYGYIIRDEVVLKGENYKNGIVQIKSEGDKIAKGEYVFRYYSDNEDNLIEKIQELDDKISEAWKKEDNLPTADIKQIDKQIEEQIELISTTNEISKISEYKKQIDTLITKKAKIAGELSTKGSYLKQLVEERTSYAEKLNSNAEYMSATKSGMLTYKVDGLESILKPNDFSNLTKEVLEGLNLKTGQMIASSNECGKIVDNFKCYIIMFLNSAEAKQSKIGDSVKLRLSTSEEITAKIVEKQENNEEIIFEITNNVDKLMSYRKISIDVIWWSHSGLKVSNDAIIKDDKTNYVIRSRVGYTDKIPVKILYTNEDYSIVENYTAEEMQELRFEADEIRNKKSIVVYDEIAIEKQ